MIPPGSWLAMLGGGQLGRMFTHAAQSLGYKVLVLDPDTASPAGAVADAHLTASYVDAPALDEIARRCRAVTTEFENVPADALDRLAAVIPTRPSAAAVRIAQDRIAEKMFFATHRFGVAPFYVVQTLADCGNIAPRLLPGILKTARLGYDGKGQVAVATVDDVREAFHALHQVPCVLEQRIALAREISVLVARSADGTMRVWPVAENTHRDGILDVTIVPARIDAALSGRASALAREVAQRLEYVGVLCVEMFVSQGGSLLVNEMAPRPHNSGHWTIDAAITSQFEQQCRALTGAPLGDTSALSPAVMVNLLGDVWFDEDGAMREPDWASVLADSRAKLHLYGKAEPRRGRKMGHVTLIGGELETLVSQAARVKQRLGITRS